MSTFNVGEAAPDFELPIRGQERFHLSDALKQGPVVLLAYVFDFSGG
ncbi:MAG: redoxin domain-containing protein [Chloroflexi bacterium]|nr:redoxin domain-containing protein [Chloroflexota bacterium]